MVFQLLSCSTCSCNSGNEVAPLGYCKVSVPGYLQGLTPFHIKSYCLFSSLCLIQAPSFSFLPPRLSTSDLNIHQFWRPDTQFIPFPGLFIGKRVLSPHCSCSVVCLVAVPISYSTFVPLLCAGVVALLCIAKA